MRFAGKKKDRSSVSDYNCICATLYDTWDEGLPLLCGYEGVLRSEWRNLGLVNYQRPTLTLDLISLRQIKLKYHSE